MSTKPCSTCGEVKPFDQFYNHKRNKDGKRNICKSCEDARTYAWREANREKVTEQMRRNDLKRRYGITLERYDELLAEQGGVCACCGAPEPGGRGYWQVDHCHDSGELRGILCHSCNVGIGHLGDNLDGVWNAMLYLVKYERMVTA